MNTARRSFSAECPGLYTHRTLRQCLSMLALIGSTTLLFPMQARSDQPILVQSTTSTANSGLYDHLLPAFENASGLQVNVVAVGTGQAIDNARNCDADVLLVHARAAEDAFVEQGFGLERHALMHNDFVLVGPADDPANVRATDTIESALRAIASVEAVFASRGDDSGTHRKERALWQATDTDPTLDSGGWYRETGSGMGATLNVAVGMQAYTLTDRATWVSFGNKAEHAILFEGGPGLLNPYGLIAVSPTHCPETNEKGAQVFIDWLLSRAGQDRIASFTVDGQQLFFPDAR